MTPRRQQSLGFTLVELMISMTLGLLIILALVTMLINVNRNNNELSTGNRVIENGRFALQLLASDASHAGYWGGYIPQFDDLTIGTTVPGDVPNAVPDPCLAFGSWDGQYRTNLLGFAVQGTSIPASVPSPTTPFCSTIVTNPQPSTDVLVVRHLEPCLAGSGTDDCADTRTAASPHLYMQVSRCSRDTTVAPNHSVTGYILNTSTFTLNAGDSTSCPDPLVANVGNAPTRRYSSTIYYVRNYAVSAGDGVPTLVRSRFGVSSTSGSGNAPGYQPAQALVEGVEGFRVEYALDMLSDTNVTVTPAVLAAALDWSSTTVLNTPKNRGNGLPDTFVRCEQSGGNTVCSDVSTGVALVDGAPSATGPRQLMNTVALKLYVLVRGERGSPGYVDTKKYCLASQCTDASHYLGPFNDNYKRHLFMQTVRLTNVSSRRETP